MNAGEKRDLAEAHLTFAKQLNGETWDLLEKAERTVEQDARLLHAAHASCYHWLQVGTGLHQQRGEWLIARVCVVLGYPEAALRHAGRCLELTEQHVDLMEDFDLAFAYEGMARASALAGNGERADEFLRLAEAAGEEIADEEDKDIFFKDFNGGEWYGVK